jgi:hypothetical protein
MDLERAEGVTAEAGLGLDDGWRKTQSRAFLRHLQAQFILSWRLFPAVARRRPLDMVWSVSPRPAHPQRSHGQLLQLQAAARGASIALSALPPPAELSDRSACRAYRSALRIRTRSIDCLRPATPTTPPFTTTTTTPPHQYYHHPPDPQSPLIRADLAALAMSC